MSGEKTPKIVIAAELIKDGLVSVASAIKTVGYDIRHVFREADYEASISNRMGQMTDKIALVADRLEKVSKNLDRLDTTFYAEGLLKESLRDFHRISSTAYPKEEEKP